MNTQLRSAQGGPAVLHTVRRKRKPSPARPAFAPWLLAGAALRLPPPLAGPPAQLPPWQRSLPELSLHPASPFAACQVQGTVPIDTHRQRKDVALKATSTKASLRAADCPAPTAALLCATHSPACSPVDLALHLRNRLFHTRPLRILLLPDLSHLRPGSLQLPLRLGDLHSRVAKLGSVSSFCLTVEQCRRADTLQTPTAAAAASVPCGQAGRHRQAGPLTLSADASACPASWRSRSVTARAAASAASCAASTSFSLTSI